MAAQLTAVFPAIVAVLASSALFVVWSGWRKAARAEYIRTYIFPKGLFEKLRKKRPELSTKDCQLVSQALRQYFLTYLKSNFQYVSMPSEVTDDLWHELILYTKNYESFCKQAFGRFFHHSPAVVLGSQRQGNAGLRRCWWFCCKEENINPKKATRLPLLFAIDAKLKIADGFFYAINCHGMQRQGAAESSGVVYCGGDFSSSSFDGTTEGFGDFGTSDSGDAGGSGGDGCGGGCGGGGD